MVPLKSSSLQSMTLIPESTEVCRGRLAVNILNKVNEIRKLKRFEPDDLENS